ncbi:MAG: polyketide synthase dehydratase domain-containing protein [Alphaproteobacteria bacterium]|nr:polyketide synthase dehydratase domain-containing protein [Alphaproteobacteria bacterium]
MSGFPPIAIVGRSCLLPGADSPQALGDAVFAARDLVTSTPADRWGMRPADVMCAPPGTPSVASGGEQQAHTGDRCWADRGGYVRGWETGWDPTGFAVPAQALDGLDPLFLWTLHTARQALAQTSASGRVQAIFGNLGFPAGLMARQAEATWLSMQPAVTPDHLAAAGIAPVDPRNRFMMGGPAALLRAALELDDAFALDAACASSLYAVKLACDRLHDGRADVVLAGAVNRADDLFIHVGFCALSALSKTGRSRPFHAGADGLVPAEGAGFVALKRLDDAQRDGDEIFGLIRGVGLSNDGRGRGLLAPAAAGQQRAMEAAWRVAGLDPRTVGLIECHATGTPVGDGTELESMGAVFGSQGGRGGERLPIGSLKSNMGHLITAAGVAGLIKVTEAMRRGARPPTLHVEDQHPDLAGSPFRVVEEVEAWAGPRRASVSAFGFGGNNAHVVVDEAPAPGWAPAPDTLRAEPELAVVGIGAVVGPAPDAATWAELLRTGGSLIEGGSARVDRIRVDMKGLRFPPNDLRQTLPQQVAVLQATREAVRGVELPRDTTGVYIGMETDPEVARYGLRWRLATWAPQWGAGGDWLGAARDGVVPELESAGVLGTMPNIPANRLNSQLDVAGPSFVVADGEASGLVALDVAARALRSGELDAAVVGAVDMSVQPAHLMAMAALDPQTGAPADAAVVLVLKRRADAEAAGETILALLGQGSGELRLGHGGLSLDGSHGVAHAARGMVHVGAAVLSLATGARPDGGTTAARSARVAIAGHDLTLTAPPGRPRLQPVRPAGPTLDLPGHLPPVALPPLPAVALARPNPTPPPAQKAPVSTSRNDSAPVPTALPQTMAPAPALPRVMDAVVVDRRPPLHGTAPAASPVAAAPAVPAAPALAPAPAGHPAALLQQYSQDLRAIHQDFLANQAALHQRFLQVRQHAMFSLLGQGSGAVQEAAFQVAPAVPPSVRPSAGHLPPQSGGRDSSTPLATPPPPAQRGEVPSAARRRGANPSPPPVAATPPTPPPAPKAAEAPVPTVGGIPVGPVPAHLKPAPTGPTLDRDGLMVHSSGNISEIYGEIFKPQDAYARVCRMPEPPLLLATRMTGLDAVPGSMGKGTIWTETDVETDSWYLNEGRMPAGVMIESGQADLMLISYLGVDLLNKGERVYRLLGCQLTYHRDLPRPGETLQYDIHVDGHANHGAVRLFFFHYDCVIDGEPALTVRQGQAGFFTDEELADSAGILWTPEEQELVDPPRLDAPELDSGRTAFTGEQIAAFAAGRPWDCFGPVYDFTRTHNRTPKIQEGDMLFLDEVTELSHRGGPWGRGYLRAVQHLADEDWFYDGHFKNDPCMPGTLMFEGCLQAMSFYMAAQGVTIKRDGWRFQPVKGEMFDLRCRGQAIPGNRELIYEIFVEEFVAGPTPTLYADLLCTIDGLKAFHARRVGLQLVPDWPITSKPELWGKPVPPGAPADHASRNIADLEGFPFDYASLLACAWGRPSEAFGPMYARFDGDRRVARLPGPPYHFMSRVTHVEGPPPQTVVDGKLVPGHVIELEFDVDPAAWYFDENGCATMPFCVFLEAALQPCGWLASYVGSALTVDRDLSFRNLDGKATWTGELLRDAGTLRTRVKIIQISKTAGMIIEGFDVQCFLTDPDGTERVVYEMNTVFGFFPKEALENQVGLPTTAAQRAFLEAESDFLVDLTARPARYCAGHPRLANPMLLMVDRIDGWWPEGGEAGLGRIRGQKDVDPGEWFFKAHFFQDPVQPGSLGLEALVQLLQWAMIEKGMGEGIENARFEPLMQHRELVWKYRGQVVPSNKVISSTMEITEVGEDEHGPFVIGDGSLWVDGKRIYEVQGMGMRIVGSPAPTEEDARQRRDYADPGAEIALAGDHQQPAAAPDAPVATGTRAAVTLDPALDRWIGDHRPTWTVPALPMATVADLLTRPVAKAGRTVTGVREVKVKRWIVVDHPVTLVAEVVACRDGEATVHLHDERCDGDTVVATGRVHFGAYPAAPKALSELSGRAEGDLYAQGRLFHGPAFHLLEKLVIGQEGASAVLTVPPGAPPVGVLHPALLDGATHPIPHDQLHRWFAEIGDGVVAYPAVLRRFDLYGPPPADGARVRCEVRPQGNAGVPELPVFRMQLIVGRSVWAEAELVEACFPKGPLGSASPADRLAFLRDRRFVPGLRLSRVADGATRLSPAEVAATDWLPGTVADLYGTTDAAEIARKEHLAAKVGVFPGAVDDALPLNEILLSSTREGDDQFVRDEGIERLDLGPVQDFWTWWFGMGRRWPVEDLYYGLMRRFLRRVVFADPAATAAVHGRPMMYLANHQVGVESLLFSILASGLNGVPTCTVAKMEHQDTWLGDLIRLCFRYPGVVDPKVITYFDRDDKASLVGIIRELAQGLVTEQVGKGGATAPGQSVMVHVEGTRSLECRTPVLKMSGAFIDMALETGTPIVPVRFVGGLPVAPLDQRIEFPVGMGTQDIWFGRPLLPEELRGMPYGERKKAVIAAINGLGPDNADEVPHEGDDWFADEVAAWREAHGGTEEHAVLGLVLRDAGGLSEDGQRLMDAVRTGSALEGDDADDRWLRDLRSWIDPKGPRG